MEKLAPFIRRHFEIPPPSLSILAVASLLWCARKENYTHVWLFQGSLSEEGGRKTGATIQCWFQSCSCKCVASFGCMRKIWNTLMSGCILAILWHRQTHTTWWERLTRHQTRQLWDHVGKKDSAWNRQAVTSRCIQLELFKIRSWGKDP